MDSYIDQLRKSKDKATVAFHRFALGVNKYGNHFFAFFEGKDNAYYSPRIKKYAKDLYPIYCGGRDKVLQVFELIRNNNIYLKYQKAFFIDRDFNPPMNQKDSLLFETPCYSIENLYVNQAAFEEILIQQCQLTRNDFVFEKCKLLFEKLFLQFNNAVELLNAWYSCLIDLRNIHGKNIGVQLTDKLPKGLVEITLKSIEADYDLTKIREIYPQALPVSEEDVLKKIEKFKAENVDAAMIFRGKYQLEFLFTILQLLIDDSKTEHQFIESKLHFPFDGVLNHDRALEIFSPYASTPEDLEEFLKRVTNTVSV